HVSELVDIMDTCNIKAIVNLDGMWGNELDANLDRYDHAYPGRFITFAQCDWQRFVKQPDPGRLLAHQLEESIARGAKGLKVWKDLGLSLRDSSDTLLPVNDKRIDEL